jgi:hypothetical protein
MDGAVDRRKQCPRFRARLGGTNQTDEKLPKKKKEQGQGRGKKTRRGS